MNRRQLIAGGTAVTLVGAGTAGAVAWSIGSSQDYDAAVAAMCTGPGSAPATLDLVRYATLAAKQSPSWPRSARHGDTHKPVVAVAGSARRCDTAGRALIAWDGSLPARAPPRCCSGVTRRMLQTAEIPLVIVH